jgi:hypothetical protein
VGTVVGPFTYSDPATRGNSSAGALVDRDVPHLLAALIVLAEAA